MVSARPDDWSKLTSDRSNKILNSASLSKCWPVNVPQMYQGWHWPKIGHLMLKLFRKRWTFEP
jgi:hypothetical protein